MSLFLRIALFIIFNWNSIIIIITVATNIFFEKQSISVSKYQNFQNFRQIDVNIKV